MDRQLAGAPIHSGLLLFITARVASIFRNFGEVTAKSRTSQLGEVGEVTAKSRSHGEVTAKSRRSAKLRKRKKERISNQPPAGPPATIQTRVQTSAPPARLSEALHGADGLRIIEAQVTSPHTHTRGTHTPQSPQSPAGAICHTQSALLSRHTGIGWSGGGGPAAAVARAGGRTRTGRSSDRLEAAAALSARARRPPSACAARARSGAGKRGGAGTRGGGGPVASRRAARARRGGQDLGQDIGRRVMAGRVNAPSNESTGVFQHPRPALTAAHLCTQA